MNRIKRVLSMVLVCVMMIALAPVVSPTQVSAAATGTTALFNGNATYLLQERFSSGWDLEANGGASNAALSGWDVDYRGGSVTSGGKATLTDKSGFEKTSISHQLMKHTGDNLVLESAFSFDTYVDGGFSYKVSGEGKTALDLSVVGGQKYNSQSKQYENESYIYVNGTKTSVQCVKGTVYEIKAIFKTSSKSVDVYINGELVAEDAKYVESATSIDNITIGTTEEEYATVKINYVYIYVNYTVNESFMDTYVTDWDIADGNVDIAPGSPYTADPYGFRLNAGAGDADSNESLKTPVNIDLPLDSTSELTWVQPGVSLSVANNIGGRNNVIEATGVINHNDNTVGVILDGNNFTFKEGDVLTYSVDYYSSSTTTVQMWLRRHGGGTITDSLQPFTAFYHTMSSSANTWKTLTKTVKYEDFGGTANEATWADAGKYALYIRGDVTTCYLDNFKVTVTREVDTSAPVSGVLRKSFDELSGTNSFTWYMLVPSTGADGFNAYFGGANFTTKNGKFYLNGQEAYTYRTNVWYKVELRTNGQTADLLINDVEKKTGVSAVGKLNQITLENTSSSAIILDDINVHKTFSKSDYTDYPTVDEVADNGDWDVGMVVYPMWREGIHYGWDAISPYEERTPYQGYYTGGSYEVSDWDNKWMLEHGIDHAIFPFVNPKEDEQAKFSVRGEAMIDGYLTSQYKDQLDFAIMLSNPLNSNLSTGSSYVTNTVPYIVERFFSNPSYKVIKNRLPVYMYNMSGFAELLNGESQLNTVLTALNNEAINLGYEGIMFMADISSSTEKYVDSFKSTYNPAYTICKWRYSWSSDKPGNMIAGIANDYSSGSDHVASIPMGFDNTPWKSNYIGMMNADQISSICASVAPGSDDLKTVVFTCWDEWGEGHFFSPSNYQGFGYMNAIRKNFTSLGEKTNETRPSDASVKRMSVLYPEGRQALKTRDDRKVYTTSDLNALTSLNSGGKSLSTTRGTTGNCSRSGNSYSSGYTYTINVTSDTSTSATVTYSSGMPSIDVKNVTAIKVNGYAENAASLVVYLNMKQNTNDEAEFPTALRFEGYGDGTTTAQDFILLPTNPEAFKTMVNNEEVSESNRTLNKIRVNPTDKTANGSKFRINSIEFFTGEFPSTHVYLNNEETHMVSEPVTENGVTYIPAYQFLLNAGCYVEWDKATKTLTAEKDGKRVYFTDGIDTDEIEGEDDELLLNADPYYKEGNIYIAYNDILRPFGYDADISEGSVYYYDKTWNKSYDDTDAKWDFEIDGNSDGWSTSSSVNSLITIKDGMLHIRSNTSDPVITKSGVSVAKADYKYMVLKAKKTDAATKGLVRLYHGSNLPSGSGVCYHYTLEPSDEIQTLVFELEKDYDTSRSSYSELGDTITNIRIDPMDTGVTTGSFYIDSLEFTNTDPRPAPEPVYSMKAYTWGDNLLQITGNSYWSYSNMTSNGEGWAYNGKHPPLVEDDVYNNVIELKPSGSNAEGLTQITWLNNGTNIRTGELFESDNILKISFWHKGQGDAKAIRIENRTGNKRDGEEYQVNVTKDEWKYFECYISADEVKEYSSDRRSIALRAIRPSSGTGSVHLRDLQICVLDTTQEVSMFTQNGVAIKFMKDGALVEEGDAYIAGYKGNEMTGMVKNSNPATVTAQNSINSSTGKGTEITATSGFHYFTPKAGTTTLKCFLWTEELEAICDPFVME